MFPVSDVIPSKTTPYVTIAIIALNALAFLYQLQLDTRSVQLVWQLFGLVPAYFSWTSLLTSMFLHEGWLHLLGNMLYLWIFGDNVEDSLGHSRVSRLLSLLRCGGCPRPGGDQSGIDDPDDWRERRDRRRHGRLFRHLPAFARTDDCLSRVLPRHDRNPRHLLPRHLVREGVVQWRRFARHAGDDAGASRSGPTSPASPPAGSSACSGGCVIARRRVYWG